MSRKQYQTMTAEESTEVFNEVLKELANLYEIWVKNRKHLTGEKVAAVDRLIDAYDKWLD